MLLVDHVINSSGWKFVSVIFNIFSLYIGDWSCILNNNETTMAVIMRQE